MSSAQRYPEQHFDEFVDQLKEWLRIPSISTDPAFRAPVRDAAEWLAAHLRQIGTKRVELAATEGHPIVYAEHFVDASRPTVLVYGHYDVQPPDPLDEWTSDPFEPEVRDGYLYGRGTCDDKGQVFLHVKALESYLQSGSQPPVNLKFIIEGEEESGSNHLRPFLEKYRDRLKADVGMISDTAMLDPDVPVITYGLRGLAYVQVELQGPSRDLHSGVYGGGVENPINVLARLIANLHDDAHRVTIPGFYDEVLELTEEERESFRQLPFDAEAWLAEVGVPEGRTEEGYTVYEATTARPSLDVNGIWGGYQGEGAKTVLPARAHAKISMRLVPDQKPHEIALKIKRYFENEVPSTVKLRFRELHGGDGVIMDTNHPAMQAAASAMEEVFGKTVHFVREGGSIPVVSEMKQILGINTVLMGFGLNSDAIHSPNERFGLDRFKKGIASAIGFMERYGSMVPESQEAVGSSPRPGE